MRRRSGRPWRRLRWTALGGALLVALTGLVALAWLLGRWVGQRPEVLLPALGGALVVLLLAAAAAGRLRRRIRVGTVLELQSRRKMRLRGQVTGRGRPGQHTAAGCVPGGAPDLIEVLPDLARK